MSLPVKVWAYNDNGKTGYDLAVTDEQATVQDYIDAMKKAIETLPFTLTRKKGLECAGCAVCCCNDSVILNWPDIVRLQEPHETKDWSLKGLLEQVSTIEINNTVVTITLKKDEQGFCSFLDQDRQLCTIYCKRPLLCQVYTCSTTTSRAWIVQELVTYLGGDDLVRRCLAEHQEDIKKCSLKSGLQPRIEDWPVNAFWGKTHYREILLKELLPEQVWNQVYEAM